MKSDLNLLQIDDTVDVTSRHVTSRHVTSLTITTPSTFGTSLHALERCILSTLFDVSDTSSRLVNFFDEHLPEIKIRKASEIHFKFKFEIAFFLKTDEFKSAFKLLLTNPGRKLWLILILLYFFKVNKL